MDFVEQVKTSVDIVKVIGEHVRLKKLGGSGRYVGLCPFHQENTPSFSVHAVHQYYKCFGCEARGDVFTFLQEIERVTFFEALKLLAERHGIPMPARADLSDPESKLRAALYTMHELAADLFQRNLHSPAGLDARAYLQLRGVSAESVAEFGLGVSLDSWDQLFRKLQQEGFPPAQIEQSGLVSKRAEGSGYYDRFRGRLMFPIHSESGKVIGFGGRAMKSGEEPKYLNSPETPLYRKSFTLYNLHRAKDSIRKSGHAVLVEGYMDVIGVFSAGVRHVVASCGTALTNTQVRALKKHSGDIVVNFDPDTAGAKAAERSIHMLIEEGLRVRVLELDGGLDPDEYVKQRGPAVYSERLSQAPGFFHWLADRARRRFDMTTSEGKISGLQFLLPAIQRVSNRLERATIAEETASYLGIGRGMVLDEFRKTAVERGATPMRRPAAEIPRSEKILLAALLASEAARSEILPRLSGLKVLGRLTLRTVFDEMEAQIASGQPFSYLGLEARLNDRDRDLLAGTIFADEMIDGENALQLASECLRAIEMQEREFNRNSLKEKIRSAERAGDVNEAIRLSEELGGLERQNRSSPKRNR